MARKYFFKFKTFQGHTCRVDIYDSTFSGTATELSKDVAGSPGCPSDNPLVIEEDNSDDLLYNVRIKTGYINLIELTNGGLSDLFPQKNDSLEVYVLIDVADSTAATDAPMETVFHGYIQAQSFQQDYLGYREEMKVPIQSVMGVLQNQEITTEYNDIANIFFHSFSDYSNIIMPVIMVDIDDQQENVMNLSIIKNILAPTNPNYNYGVKNDPDDDEEEAPKPLIPLTKAEFLKKFCDTFGLISHDVGMNIVFTKIGYSGEYRKYANDGQWDDHNWNAGYGNTINLFDTYFKFAGTGNKKAYVDSLRKVTMSWEEKTLPVKADFSVCSIGYGGLLKYDGNEITSNMWYQNTHDSNNMVAIYGDGEKEEIDARVTMQSSRVTLFYCHFTFWGMWNKIHIKKNKDFVLDTGSISVSVQSMYGSYYNFNYDPDDPEDEYWVDSPTYGSVIFDSNGECDMSFVTSLAPTTGIIVGFFSTNVKIRIEEISVEYNNTNNATKYSYPVKPSNSFVVHLDDDAIESIDADVNFWKYSNGYFNKPTFNYLGISQRNLTLQVRKKTSITELELLMGKMAMSATDQTNRVISTRYNVRDDIFELQIMGNQYF